MNRSVRAKVIVGLIASIGILALVAFLVYWNRGGEAETRGSISLSLIAGFSGMALVLSGTSAGLLVRELRSSAMKSMSIAANEAEYHELCDNAFDLIDMLTPNGKFIYTNRAWREVLGYSAEEAAHLWLKDVVHPEDLSFAQRSICGLLAGEPGRNRFEVRFRKKNGETMYLEGTVNCRRQEDRPTVIQGNSERRHYAEEGRTRASGTATTAAVGAGERERIC